ncbi:hypothetical protein D3C87_1540820 [compost metagenome]
MQIKKIQIGNIYQFDTDNGLALFQLVNIPVDTRNDVEMIKVSYRLYDKISQLTEEIFENGFFC